jgi:hypothetical protein
MTSREIVYDFADFMGDRHTLIDDVRDLPFQKNQIIGAFLEHIQLLDLQLELERDSRVKEQVDLAKRLLMHLFDFQEIDDCDKDFVHLLNHGKNYEYLRSHFVEIVQRKGNAEDQKEFLKKVIVLQHKYFVRATSELEEWINKQK